MRMNELVGIYESTRRTAADTGTWRLRRWARRERRALEQDRGAELHQVRLVAIEDELVGRGAQEARTSLVR
jgi:hypothetical protein